MYYEVMTNHAELMKGNQYGVKLKDPELRQLAYTKYCEWLARGKSKRSFTFVEGEFMCHYLTIESYMKLYPNEFDAKKKDVAFALGYSIWEDIADGTANGSNKKACVPALNMVLRNKYGWDSSEASTAAEEGRTDLRQYSAALKTIRPSPLPEPATDRNDSPASTTPPQA